MFKTVAKLLPFCILVAGCNASQPGRELVDTNPAMEYCRSEANTSPDKGVQLHFLRTHELEGTDEHSLEVNVGTKERPILVRYVTSDYPDMAGWRCHFYLVRTPDHPEKDAGRLSYVRDNRPFRLEHDKVCLSTVPPQVDAAREIATLRCDQIVAAPKRAS